ncbi:MAG: sugar ABC transporter permease [Acidimicrobiales bacterium]
MPPTSRPDAPTVAGEPQPSDAVAASTPTVDDAVVLTSSDLVVSSFGEYLHAWGKRIRNGESGVLPVLGGLALIVVIFQSQSSVFLSAGNLTNLLVQGAPFVLLGMAEVFVLLLGEIDLSIGYVSAVGAVVTVALADTSWGQPWWVAILGGVAVTTAIGAMQGLLITRLRLPSFVVTLAGLLGWEGVLIFLADREGGKNGGGTIRITSNLLNDLANGNLSPVAGWVIMVLAVAAFGGFALIRDRHRRSSGLVAPPAALTALKVGVMAVAGIVLVLVCNTNRGRLVAVQGVPWAVLIVLGVLAVWTFVLGRTRFGRYVYAIGGNAEAARRAGVSLGRIRLLAFALTGLTSGLAGIVYASRLGSISNNVDGGELVLYAVAAAVIGGTSLFGGRGRMIHALLGGLVIATIANGMGLIGLSAAAQYMVTALVLLAAVTVDAVARRGSAA